MTCRLERTLPTEGGVRELVKARVGRMITPRDDAMGERAIVCVGPSGEANPWRSGQACPASLPHTTGPSSGRNPCGVTAVLVKFSVFGTRP